MSIMMSHEFLTVHEAATILRVSVPTIYRRCADGRLAHIRVGGGDGPIRVLASALVVPDTPIPDQSVSDDGSRQGQLRPAQAPSERRGTQTIRGQSSPPAHTGQEGES
jgi:excisionase family DNA binding protein